MGTIVKMTDGRLTLPVDIRRALGVSSDQSFEIETAPDQDALVLRPAAVLRREDAWAYTSEHRELLVRAHADSAEGRVHRLTEAELAAIGETR
ncbi:MAG: hypothetical protein ACRDPW_06175 [Mycobacteriales bacterium]